MADLEAARRKTAPGGIPCTWKMSSDRKVEIVPSKLVNRGRETVPISGLESQLVLLESFLYSGEMKTSSPATLVDISIFMDRRQGGL